MFKGTTTWKCPTGVTSVDYLVVAGGGGGGSGDTGVYTGAEEGLGTLEEELVQQAAPVS